MNASCAYLNSQLLRLLKLKSLSLLFTQTDLSLDVLPHTMLSLKINQMSKQFDLSDLENFSRL